MSKRWENFTQEQKKDIGKLTNWQRHQWTRAGYPDDTARFVTLTKENRNV